MEAHIKKKRASSSIVFILRSVSSVRLEICGGAIERRRSAIFWNNWILYVLDFFAISPKRLEESFVCL